MRWVLAKKGLFREARMKRSLSITGCSIEKMVTMDDSAGISSYPRRQRFVAPYMALGVD